MQADDAAATEAGAATTRVSFENPAQMLTRGGFAGSTRAGKEPMVADEHASYQPATSADLRAQGPGPAPDAVRRAHDVQESIVANAPLAAAQQSGTSGEHWFDRGWKGVISALSPQAQELRASSISPVPALVDGGEHDSDVETFGEEDDGTAAGLPSAPTGSRIIMPSGTFAPAPAVPPPWAFLPSSVAPRPPSFSSIPSSSTAPPPSQAYAVPPSSTAPPPPQAYGYAVPPSSTAAPPPPAYAVPPAPAPTRPTPPSAPFTPAPADSATVRARVDEVALLTRAVVGMAADFRDMTASRSRPDPDPTPDGGNVVTLLAQSMADMAGNMHAMSAAQVASAEALANKMPKELRELVDPGHNLAWATTQLDYLPLERSSTSLSPGELARLAPTTVTQLVSAQSHVQPRTLLIPLKDLTASHGGQGSIAVIDYAEYHCGVLRHLVAAVAHSSTMAVADAEAARLLFNAMQWAAMQTTPDHILLRKAWAGVHETVAPRSPTTLLIHLARAFVRYDLYGADEAEYSQYLMRRFQCVSIESTPTLVLQQALRLASDRYKRDSVAKQHQEAKKLFRDWVHHHSANTQLQELFATLLDRTESIAFARLEIDDWAMELQNMEKPRGSLAELVSSFAAPTVPTRRADRAPRINALGGGGDQQQPPPQQPAQPPASATPPPPPPPIQPAPPFKSPAPPTTGTGQTQLMFAPNPDVASVVALLQQMGGTAAAAAVNALKPTYRAVPPPGLQPGLHPSMQAAFVPQHGTVMAVPQIALPSSYFVAKDPAFDVHSSRASTEWVAKYGCTGYTPPAANSLTRPWLKVVEICKVAGIPLPPGFKNEKHKAGETCPFCAFVSVLHAFNPIQWYTHPEEPVDSRWPQGPRPSGTRQCAYVHQVFKCGYGLAVAHAIVRRDRDNGRGDVNVHLFEPNDQGPPRL